MQDQYEMLLTAVKRMNNEELKKKIFEMNQSERREIEILNLDADQRKKIEKMFNDRTSFEMLLVNAFAGR